GRTSFVREVWAVVRLGGEQIEFGCRDVHSRVGGWRGGVGLAATVVGVGR
ncbi:hypothetical protein A2U01_0111018, partial [Trifolium medium]|nr:hypothetical protein [Trifolium medium]